MKYQGLETYQHGTPRRLGVLLTNLGTPDAATPKALRRYLAQFLWDPRVVELPRPLWWLILNGIILNTRPKKSAAAYQEVWTEQGSPLLTIAQAQQAALQARLQTLPFPTTVALGMRYGQPSIANALKELQQAAVTHLLVLPLYPHYAAATVGSTFDAVAEALRHWRWLPQLRMNMQYHEHPLYLNALEQSIRQHFQAHGQPQQLLFSFHGIPLRYLLAGDPYHCQCHKTARLVAERLGLTAEQWAVSFQSRFGREPWLKPYTDDYLKSLPAQGIKEVAVICPGFSADCLETIEEIGQENREYFMHAGGQVYHYIPALNAEAAHLDLMVALVKENCAGWERELTGSVAAADLALAKGAKQ
jgi:ferrochelatase